MRERDIFKAIRQLGEHYSLKFRIIFLVTFEILFSFSLALGIDSLLVWILGDLWKFPTFVEFAIIAFLVGIFATDFLMRWLIQPLNDVGPAMEMIADGDFTVRLSTNSSSKEIQEIYAGFNMMAEELSATEIIQTDFISNVSHEIKTPISAIEGYSMLLQDEENLTEEQKEYVNKIIFNTKRLSTLTGSILLLSKLENQSILSKRVTFPLDEQIRKSILAQESEWTRKNIDFDINLDDTEYNGNEGLMHHIWDNLISNAIKFSPKNSEIRVLLTNLPSRIIFEITDRGPGISDEGKKHIFDKFYQEDSSHKQYGNGLGLALVQKIVDIEGGEIKVTNNDGAGCTFTVILTKQPPAEDKAKPQIAQQV